MSESGSFITIDERMYRYVRQFAIKNVYDAVVELLTNSNDAYVRAGTAHKHYWIKIFSETQKMVVLDNATGLSGQKMRECFLTVGAYTSSVESRGFFSRGAKDISILGNVTFESIHNNLYSRCTIDVNAYGMMHESDVPATQEIRNRLGISSGNGMSVTLDILPTIHIDDPIMLSMNIRKRASLRDILLDQTNDVYFEYFYPGNLPAYREKLRYVYPEGHLVLDLQYVVAGYDVPARFVLYQSDKPISQPMKDNQLEFGFLIKSGRSIHEVSTLDERFRWHPYIDRVYGYLQCDYINELLHAMDQHGPTTLNPTTIIDPSRFTGLNRDHPFTQALFSIPLVRLDFILKQLDASLSSQSVTINEFDEIINEIEKYGLHILDNIPTSNTFTEDYTQKLIDAIDEDRQQYVTVERNFMLESSSRFSSKEKEILESIEKSSERTRFVYLINDNGEVQEIDTNDIDIMNSELQPDMVKEFYEKLKNYTQNNTYTMHPYIYKLNEDGQLVKLYIFNQGSLSPQMNPEENSIQTFRKAFNIKFSKDINLKHRYVISITDKIDIIINLNDPTIKLFLSGEDHNNDGEITGNELTINFSSLQDINNNKAYVFFAQLFVEIFSRILLQGKVINDNISLEDGSTVDRINRVYYHFDNLVTQISVPITDIFMRYYYNNTQKMLEKLVGMIAEADPNAAATVGALLADNARYLF